MIVIPVLTPLLAAAGKEVAHWTDTDNRLQVQAISVVYSAVCPDCGSSSSRCHGLLWRTLADCPSFGSAVTLEIQVRRFKCINPACRRRTFSEPIEPLAGRRQRRTWRLRRQHLLVGYALGGEAGARLAAHLGMRLSGAALLAQMRAAGCPSPESSSLVVGIDDWAIARGNKYGTIVVDLQQHRPIELLAGRDASSVIPWLREQPAVKVIARDRASAYADAARRIVPDAQQVADRWHLMGNLCEVIERLLQRHASHMREAARQVNEALQLDVAPAQETASVTSSVALRAPKPRGWQRLSEQRRAARLARYEEAVRQYAGGASIKSIARAMKLNYRTVRNFVRAGSYPERARRSRGPTLSEAQRQYVVSRVAEGCHNAIQLWRELKAQGFVGHCSVVHDAMAQACAATPEGRRCGVVAGSAPAMGVPSSRRACAWLLGCKDPDSEEQDAGLRRRFVETLCTIEPSIAEARGLAQRFLGFIHRKDLAGFDRWLPRVRTCNVPELRRFSVKLREDLSAVRAAFSSPWSSGQVEGQINRLKYLKRQMYGRAKLDLLRIRVLHPN